MSVRSAKLVRAAQRWFDEAEAYIRHGAPDLALERLERARREQVFVGRRTDTIDALEAQVRGTVVE